MALVDRTGIVIPLSRMRTSFLPLQSGNCLSLANSGDLIGPISFAWAARYTLFFKALVRSTPNGAARILDGANGNAIYLSVTGVVVINNGATVQTDGGQIVVGTMHDYAVVYDGSFVRVYTDGIPSGAVALTTDPVVVAGNYTIFNRAAGDRNCDMNVCELQWYNQAFQPTDIAAHYRSAPNDTAGLAFRYKLHEGTGMTITDSSGKGLSTTLTGGSWTTFALPGSSSTYGDVAIPARTMTSARTVAAGRVAV